MEPFHVIATNCGSLEDFLLHTLPMNDQMVAKHTSPKHTNNQGMQLQGGGHCFWMVVLGFRDCDQCPEPRMEDPNIKVSYIQHYPSSVLTSIVMVYWLWLQLQDIKQLHKDAICILRHGWAASNARLIPSSMQTNTNGILQVPCRNLAVAPCGSLQELELVPD